MRSSQNMFLLTALEIWPLSMVLAGIQGIEQSC